MATIQTRLPDELKKNAEAVFTSMGLGLSEGIRLFLQQTVNAGALPFQPLARIPNAETIAAMEELDRGGGKRSSFEEWRADLWKDDD